jgi:hypothetical protein
MGGGSSWWDGCFNNPRTFYLWFIFWTWFFFITFKTKKIFFVRKRFLLTKNIFKDYSTLSFSIYRNKAAIAKPGKKIPKIGTRIDGK